MFQSFDPVSDKGFAARHLPKLRALLTAGQLDGLLVPHDDEYQNEYLPDCFERLMWVSGFSGSAGFGIVMTDKAAIFSDGRYTLQLREQVDTTFYSLHQTPDSDPATWLTENTPKGARIGYDPMVFTEASLAPFVAAASDVGFELVSLSENPIDAAWDGRPAAPKAKIVPHPAEYAGESSDSKRQRLAAQLQRQGADAALLTAPTSLAWLFNIRGGDLHASPLPLGRAVLHKDGSADVYVDPDKLDSDVRVHLGNHVGVHPETEVLRALTDLGRRGAKVLIDPTLTPIGFVTALTTAGATIAKAKDPCALPRATKNDAELDGTRAAHIRDGVVMVNFLHWLESQSPSPALTEIAVAKKLEEFRRATGVLRDISFDTISGAGPHAAIPHYRATTQSDLPLADNTIFLIDSGGQYQDGTTDITRTVIIGTPATEMKRHFTLVLKGHIALATARFPAGTSGHQLDALARKPLWDAGLDYDHGTGHGVGSYMGVHEGPQNISKKPIAQALMPGMICSNEPGYYKAGAYGIRIENLIIVTPPMPVPGGERGMMAFETITFAPIDRRLIDPALLTTDERTWINHYHKEVRTRIGPHVAGDVRTWLDRVTAEI